VFALLFSGHFCPTTFLPPSTPAPLPSVIILLSLALTKTPHKYTFELHIPAKLSPVSCTRGKGPGGGFFEERPKIGRFVWRPAHWAKKKRGPGPVEPRRGLAVGRKSRDICFFTPELDTSTLPKAARSEHYSRLVRPCRPQYRQFVAPMTDPVRSTTLIFRFSRTSEGFLDFSPP
jgi:hypothetical protein